MARKAEPKETVYLKLPIGLVDRLDSYIDGLSRKADGYKIPKNDVIAKLIEKALDAENPIEKAAE